MTCNSPARFEADDDVRDCVCPVNTYVIEDFDNNSKSCSQTCDADAWPGPLDTNVPACVRCPFEGQVYNRNTDDNVSVCECDARTYVPAAGICIPAADAQRFTRDNSEFSTDVAYTISYSFIETKSSTGYTISPQSASSGTIQYYYLDAAVGCDEYRDVKKCQLLANLCVLQLYDPQAVVCKLYKDIVEKLDAGQAYPENYPDEGFQIGMPWLFYETKPSNLVI